MTKKSTKRALLSSVLALVLCFSMLLGTTYAWFTDSVTSAGNIIKSGTLDVEMSWAETPNATEWTDASVGAIFNYDKWEPGYTQVRYVKIENKGNLAFKYQTKIVPANADADANKLAEVIDVYYTVAPTAAFTRESIAAATPTGTLKELIAADNINGVLLPAGATAPTEGGPWYTGSIILGIALKMQESAGNEYQNLSLGEGFSVQLLATQYEFEKDSFDEHYDAQADGTPDNNPWPVASISASGTTVSSKPDTTDGDLIITSSGDLESASVPAAVAIALYEETGEESIVVANADPTKSDLTLNLNVAKKAENLDSTTGVTTVDLEIDMSAIMVNKDSNGETLSTKTKSVHELGEYVTINYNIGAGKTIGQVTHNGVVMENSTDTNDDTNGAGVWSYADGTLTIKTKSLSPFAVEYTIPVAVIGSKGYDSVQEAFDAAVDGDTITLMKDVELTESTLKAYSNQQPVGVQYRKNAAITFDMGGHTLSSASESGINHVLHLTTGTMTIKNGTLSNHSTVSGDQSALLMTGDAVATIKDNITIDTFGNGIMVGLFASGAKSTARITELNAVIRADGLTGKNNKCVLMVSNTRIDEITGGTYDSFVSMDVATMGNNCCAVSVGGYSNQWIEGPASIGTISGGTFTSSFPGTLRIDGTVETISGGVFTYYDKSTNSGVGSPSIMGSGTVNHFTGGKFVSRTKTDGSLNSVPTVLNGAPYQATDDSINVDGYYYNGESWTNNGSYELKVFEFYVQQ